MMILLQQPGPEDFFSAEKLTLVGTLVAVIWAIMTQRLVPGPFYEDLKRENERLRQALAQWRETGRTIAGTAQELAAQQPLMNQQTAKQHQDTQPESDDATAR
jgi:hypothetical protein